MTPPSKRFQAWRAADLANSNHWIFAAEASLAAADPDSLRAWCQPLISELQHGCGVALVRGPSSLSTASPLILPLRWTCSRYSVYLLH